MKRIISMILAVAFVFSMSAVTFAAGEEKGQAKAAFKAEIEGMVSEFKDVKGEVKELHEKIVAARMEIKELLQSIKESGDKEKLEGIKEYRDQLKAVNNELKALRESIKQAREELKAARQAKDVEAAKAKIAQLIDYKNQVIEKQKVKLGLLESIKAVLQ